jgi:phosphomannomutase
MSAEVATVFQCPGEAHSISRSVHLARLAACYPACRECPQRHDTGATTRGVVELLQATERRVARGSLFIDEGVRGIYLNELARPQAAELASTFASLLWEDSNGWLMSNGRPLPAPAARTIGPTVVVGHDERPASPDLVTGVAGALRRMGCYVIDVGLVTRPTLWFAVDHLRADGGIHVTGSGCDPAWTGLDFVGAAALPISHANGLHQIEERFRAGVSRWSRHPGSQRMFLANVPYVAGLWKHFHALRPLRISLGCPSLPLRKVLEQVFEKLACRRVSVEIPVRARDLSDPADADCRRIAESVRQNGSDLGLLIDDDGQRCAWFDERGNLIAANHLAWLLAEREREQQVGQIVVMERSRHAPRDEPNRELASIGDSAHHAERDRYVTAGQLGDVSLTMRSHSAICGGGNSGRVWFADAYPICDAVLTLAKVLQALSRSDTPFSEVVAAVSRV